HRMIWRPHDPERVDFSDQCQNQPNAKKYRHSPKVPKKTAQNRADSLSQSFAEPEIAHCPRPALSVIACELRHQRAPRRTKSGFSEAVGDTARGESPKCRKKPEQKRRY